MRHKVAPRCASTYIYQPSRLGCQIDFPAGTNRVHAPRAVITIRIRCTLTVTVVSITSWPRDWWAGVIQPRRRWAAFLIRAFRIVFTRPFRTRCPTRDRIACHRFVIFIAIHRRSGNNVKTHHRCLGYSDKVLHLPKATTQITLGLILPFTNRVNNTGRNCRHSGCALQQRIPFGIERDSRVAVKPGYVTRVYLAPNAPASCQGVIRPVA
jgi:hypothetical protein